MNASSITDINKLSEKEIYNYLNKVGIQEYAKLEVEAINKRVSNNKGPIQQDEITSMDFALHNDNKIILKNIIDNKQLLKIFNVEESDIDGKKTVDKMIKEGIRTDIKMQNTNSYCSIKFYNIFMKLGGKIEILYRYDDGRFLESYMIEHKDCN